MSQDEEQYKKDLAAAGVELPKEEAAPEEKSEEATPDAKTEEKSEDEADKPTLKTTEPKVEPVKPRSIYDDLKDRKKELRTEKELREQAERERDELRTRLESVTEAKGDNPQVEEDALAYAKKVGADPELVQKIITEARKGFKAEIDPTLTERLDKFENWQKTNSKAIEAQMFNDEFEKTVPSLKNLFPNVNDDELKAMKAQLDTLSHTKEWHDKDLEYIAYKHKDTLSAVVSPKKRGMESKGRKQVEGSSFEFDPTADYASLSPQEKKQWEAAYKKATSSTDLITNAQGKKIII